MPITDECLFFGGLGRTSNPEEFDSLMTGLEDQVLGIFGDGTVVYPDPGDDTNLGEERPPVGGVAREWLVTDSPVLRGVLRT